VSLELKDRAESPVRPRQPDFMEQKNGEKKAAQKEFHLKEEKMLAKQNKMYILFMMTYGHICQ